MKARPILFTGENVCAMREYRKHQTRRIMILQPPAIATSCGVNTSNDPLHIDQWQWLSGEPSDVDTWAPVGDWFTCPFGQPGDLLWVRETWQHSNFPDGPPKPDCTIFHRADYLEDPLGPDLERSADGIRRRWKPAIHMPRWASRLTLRITDVRVERLREISCADAIAEGCHAVSLHDLDCDSPDPRDEYRTLWESINGIGSWEANPWVWTISFSVIKQNVDVVLKAAA